MTQYIDKSALVAEIEKRITDNKKDIERASHKNLEDYFEGYEDALALLKQQYLDTLEVKEVDLDESARYYLLHEHISPLNEVLHQANLKMEMQYHKDIEDAYKAGFELGFNAQKGEKV